MNRKRMKRRRAMIVLKTNLRVIQQKNNLKAIQLKRNPIRAHSLLRILLLILLIK